MWMKKRNVFSSFGPLSIFLLKHITLVHDDWLFCCKYDISCVVLVPKFTCLAVCCHFLSVSSDPILRASLEHVYRRTATKTILAKCCTFSALCCHLTLLFPRSPTETTMAAFLMFPNINWYLFIIAYKRVRAHTQRVTIWYRRTLNQCMMTQAFHLNAYTRTHI